MAKIILGFIALTFAVWGVNWYFSGSGKQKPAATVGDSEISQQDFQEALQQQQREAAGQHSELDTSNPKVRRHVLDQLVNTRLLALAAVRSGLLVSKAQIDSLLTSLEPFQVNGKFSEARLDAWLQSRGMSRAQFAAMLRQDMLLRQEEFSVGQGALVSKAATDRLGKLLSQQREVQELSFDVNKYAKGVKVDDKAVKAEYDAHPEDYSVPEQVRVQYAVLSPDALLDQVHVDDAAAKQYYKANQAQYQEPEQRRASHILIKVDANMDAKARAAAKAKAEAIYRELQAHPDRFSELAKKDSQDAGSAARGGDLGLFTRNMMVKPFADAVFSMHKGEIRGPVQTQFGYHIIRLDDIVPGTKLAFGAVKGQILDQLRQQEAQRLFIDAADQFSNMVYEQPDSLEPVAKKFHLKLQESDWLTHKPEKSEIFNNPRLLDAIFDPDTLQKHENTEAVEVAPNTLVAARVTDHHPQGVRPFAEVAAEISHKLVARMAREQAVAAGKKALESARAGQPPVGMSAPMTVSHMHPLELSPDAIQAVFKAPTQKLPVYVGVEGQEGYQLYRINRVSEGQISPDQMQAIQRRLQQMVANDELHAYLEYNRDQTTITVNQDVLKKSE